ncbi:NPP1 family protein [Vibrio sp. Isolate23]|uniref:NPP1 family protein n=1 Tax=Vibrio sp. Isolate23 TaxID=2908533 RepID=UPI001EFD6948|nr:NPP1 family protein [Vibrio sp. Isolate23]MCG9682339.1 NPP1 family protein [Vibrio sp. Isolate23]
MKRIFFYLLLTAPNFVNAEEFPRLDEALPSMIDITRQTPIMDWDGDGCYPAAGISRSGKMNDGLKTTGAINGSCHDAGFLDISNTLHRYACISGTDGSSYCAQAYDNYYEKDQAIHGSGIGGHKHDWESIIVWTKDSSITHGSVSCHGDMETKSRGELPMDGEHLKVVYHKDGAGTHCNRFAKPGELAENHYGKFVLPTITSWYELQGDGLTNQQMRDKLNSFDYGSASIKVRDSSFLSHINRWRPSGYPEFTQESVEDSNPNQ